MTEKNKEESRTSEERIGREFLQAHRHHYSRMYRRRWGVEPPTLRATRIVYVHDEAEPLEGVKAAELLSSRGASVEEWCPNDPGFPTPPDRQWDALVIAISALPEGEAGESFRLLLFRAVRGGTFIAAIGKGVCLLAEEGFLEGRHASFPPEEGEKMAAWGVHPAGSPLHRDGSILTCAREDQIPDLAGTLLDLLKQPLPEEGETR